MDSVEKKIERILVEGGEGKVYFPDDFFECGSEKAISKALQRLVARGVLMRMSRGIYCVPKPSAWGMGPLPASVDEILARLKSRDGFRTGPCGCEAQNMLGLSEQVVMNPVYSTDGPTRRIPYAKKRRPIVLYHVPPKVFNYKSEIIMLTVIALNDIGKNDLWQFDLDRMQDIYRQIPYSEIRNDLKNTPSWIRNLILGFYGKAASN